MNIRTILTRIPGTLALVAVVLLVGILGQGLWSPTHQQPLWDSVAYGLPALQDGRWWTPLTGTFFVASPWGYPIGLAGFVWVGLLEWKRGSRTALVYFAAGQIIAVLATAAFLWATSLLPWPWAVELAGMLDVGP